MSDSVKSVRSGKILEVTLDRPKANAIDAATSREMGEVFCDFRDDPELRVAIITGGGEKFFSAGWDLKAAADGAAIDGDYGPGGFAGITELHNCNKPIIAAVNGMAVGGGMELALSTEMIVAAEHAEFFLPEVFVGIVADAGSFRLPKRIPRQIAMEMLMTGRHMSADEAMRWGMINKVCPADKLMDEARALAETIVGAAPLAVAAVKEIVRETHGLSIEDCYALLHSRKLPAYEAMLHSEDAKEGPTAFAEKRDPVWQGR